MSSHSADFHDDITDVPGIMVGHAQDIVAKTGVTVILPPRKGAAAGLYVGGSAPSTRQMDSLRPLHVVDRVHGICLCGGSAFGLDAGGGVLSYLEEQGTGFEVVGKTIPIVPSAAIFDLNFGDGSVRPDHEMGRRACANASSKRMEQGSIGAGTGATVGKLFGVERAMKGGLGSSSCVSHDLVVGTLVVVNAYGDITNPEGALLAGCRTSAESLHLADAKFLLQEGMAESRKLSVEDTTLAVIAVNARLDKIAASRIAAQATLGMARVIRPFHSHIDGDLTIVLSVGDKKADPNRISFLAQDSLQRSVVNAIMKANGLGVLPAWKDLSAGRES
ncbi:MAG TPA: P1 family peptidase [Desulfomonilaceae bacterium]|nr:P1 family peptidase [Desulfomonilaceae bacterium]